MGDGTFNNHIIANCLENATVKNFKNQLLFVKDTDN